MMDEKFDRKAFLRGSPGLLAGLGASASAGGSGLAGDRPGGARVPDLQGNLFLHRCSADREAPGNFVKLHILCPDSRGDLYAGEVTWTFRVSRGGCARTPTASRSSPGGEESEGADYTAPPGANRSDGPIP